MCRCITHSVFHLCPEPLVDAGVQFVEALVALHAAPPLHVLRHWHIATHSTKSDNSKIKGLQKQCGEHDLKKTQ